MNVQRFLRLVCYDNELSWIHHHSVWFATVIINICILFADGTPGAGRSLMLLSNIATSLYPPISYYVQFAGINMPSTVKNYCDPPFYAAYWGCVSYYGAGAVIGKNMIGMANLLHLIRHVFLSLLFMMRYFTIISYPDEYNRYLEKCEHYKKPTIEFGEVVIS